MRNGLLHLHKDTRGAISVLALLTIWVSIAVVAMIWNQVEYAQKKQTLQAAADASAHSAAEWTSKATNAIAGQNMIICQDAAAQTIWEACMLVDPLPGTPVQPDGTYAKTSGPDIKGRLAGELKTANAMLNDAKLNPRQRRLQALLTGYESEKGLLQNAITDLAGNLAEGNYPNPQAATDFAKQVRQAQSAMNWVDQTYMNGAAPTAGRPGPPAPGNEGLIQYAEDQMKKQDPNIAVLELIINYINTVELPIMQGPDNAAPGGRSFETRTGPAVSQAVDAQCQAHEEKVFETQEQMLEGVTDAVDQQKDQFATFYKADITLATPKNDGSDGSAKVTAPVYKAVDVDPGLGMGYTDTIRTMFPQEAAAAGLVATFDIDPVNPQTADPDVGDARVWHPNLPTSLVPVTNNTYSVFCNSPGGWGHIWCMPVERYYNGRVSTDEIPLNTTYMQYLDNSRNNRPTDPRDLAWQIRQILGLNNGQPQIQPLPKTINDDQPDDKGVVEQIPVLPNLAAPATATAKFRTQVMLYNQHAGKFIGAVNALRNILQNNMSIYTQFTVSFASSYWGSAVAQARDDVLQQLGLAKTFMVLSTYKLRYIPEELRGGMEDSATLAIQDAINSFNIGSGGSPGTVTNRILNDLLKVDPDGVAKTQGRNFARAYYSAEAVALALQYVPPIAHIAAVNIAREWINRPWPYEITPTTLPVPPWRGLGKDDRQQYFTVLAAAKQTDGTTPRFLLPKIFSTPPTLVTYAQSETLNWNEYNNNYGGNERFDQVSIMDYEDTTGYGPTLRYIPVPRCWRLSTLGGWAWQPRLSLGDAMGLAMQNNPEFQWYLNTAGITGTNQDDYDVVGLH